MKYVHFIRYNCTVQYKCSAIKSIVMIPMIFYFCWHCHRGINYMWRECCIELL